MKKFTFEKFYLYYNLFCLQLVRLLIILEGAVLGAISIQNLIRIDVRYFSDPHFYSNIMKFSENLFWILVVIIFFRLMKNLFLSERQNESLYEATGSSTYQFFRVISDINPMKGLGLPMLMMLLCILPDVPNKYSFTIGLDGFVPQTVTEKNFAQFYHTMEKTYSGNGNILLTLLVSLIILIIAQKLIRWTISKVVFEEHKYNGTFADLQDELFEKYADGSITTEDFDVFVRQHFLKEEVRDLIVVDKTYLSGYRKGAYFTQTMTINFYSKLGRYIGTTEIYNIKSYPETAVERLTPVLGLAENATATALIKEMKIPTETGKEKEALTETNKDTNIPTETTSAVIHKTETVSGFAQVSPEFVTEKSLRLKQFQRGGFSQMRGRILVKRNNKKRTE